MLMEGSLFLNLNDKWPIVIAGAARYPQVKKLCKTKSIGENVLCMRSM